MPFVEVVDVVTVDDALVTATRTVLVAAVVGVLGVGRLALVPVIVVAVVSVTVVEVVDVVFVGDGGMAAVGPVGVGMGIMDRAGRHQCVLSLAWVMASSAMWATWSSARE